MMPKLSQNDTSRDLAGAVPPAGQMKIILVGFAQPAAVIEPLNLALQSMQQGFSNEVQDASPPDF